MLELENKLVLVTGVGLKPVEHIFRDITTGEPTHTPVVVDGQEFKANIGAATALECAKAGADVFMVSKSEDKLEIIKRWIKDQETDGSVSYLAADLYRESQLEKLMFFIKTRYLPVYLVHSIGVGSGAVQLKDDNPYVTIDEASHELIQAELSVIPMTQLLIQHLLPIFRQQPETRACIITSMTADRAYWAGSVHAAAKAGLSGYVRGLRQELTPERIYISEIKPGGVDTGLYDSAFVTNRITEIAKRSFGWDWSKENGGPKLVPPSAVGKMIVHALASKAYIPEVKLIARGQFPHLGA